MHVHALYARCYHVARAMHAMHVATTLLRRCMYTHVMHVVTTLLRRCTFLPSSTLPRVKWECRWQLLYFWNIWTIPDMMLYRCIGNTAILLLSSCLGTCIPKPTISCAVSSLPVWGLGVWCSQSFDNFDLKFAYKMLHYYFSLNISHSSTRYNYKLPRYLPFPMKDCMHPHLVYNV